VRKKAGRKAIAVGRDKKDKAIKIDEMMKLIDFGRVRARYVK
tara:strand:- start:1801 stop:1926 length:126 start_codon:yes stop_codon:yes gene_type:complete